MKSGRPSGRMFHSKQGAFRDLTVPGCWASRSGTGMAVINLIGGLTAILAYGISIVSCSGLR